MTAQANMIGRPIRDLDTPVLLVDLDKLDRNIARMRQVIIAEAGIGWRPHTKAIKTPAIAHKLLQAGAHGVTCAKLSEAEVMAAAGIRDIMIANQIVGNAKITRLVHLLLHADIIVAVDCDAQVKALDAAAQAAKTRLRVVVEVNIAMNRAGVEPGEPVVILAKQVASCRGLHFAGLMAWEGGRLAELPEPLDVGEVKSLNLSAEHTTIELATARSAPGMGDQVEFVAGYSDSTVFLHDHLYGVRNGCLEAVWPILGRGKLL